MNRSSRIAAAAGVLALGAAVTAPAYALQTYIPPKLLVRGSASHGIDGNGTVIVQVQVNADGTHKVIKVIRSSNAKDNAAALDIAQSSTYRPAKRNGKVVTAFYDYTLKFTGATVSGKTPLDQIAGYNRTGQYASAKAAAQKYLAAHPNVPRVEQQLGIAEFFLKDNVAASAAFAKAGTIAPSFRSLAAHAYASAAVTLATQSQPDAQLATDYGTRALALDHSANSYYALGIAQLSANDTAGATANLTKARSLAFADKQTASSAKFNLDAALLQAYVAGNDLANADKIRTEMKKLDPSSTLGDQIVGNELLRAGMTNFNNGQYPDAIKQFDQAAAEGTPAVQVTAYSQAAFAEQRLPKPDYNAMKAYADKALAIKADDPIANYAEAVALTGLYAASHKADQKKQALDYSNKAIQYAKAANNDALVKQIQGFVKSSLQK